MNKDELINHIYNVLCSSRFSRWYDSDGGNFDSHIRRCDDCPSEEQIKKEIESMFKLSEFRPQ